MQFLLRGVLTFLTLAIVGSTAARADPAFSHRPPTAEAEASTSLQSKSYIGAPQETYQLFVFGDSLAAGLFSGMSRMAEGDLRIAVDGRFKDDSGLARPEFYDWAAALPKIHERREIDIAVILLGSNDGQDIRSISGQIQFSTPEWASTYAQRIDNIITLLKNRGVAIYWVELPPMGPEPLEGEASYIATIQRDRAVREKIRYVETRKVFSDVNGFYTDQGADPTGKVTRLRSRDGIHFLKSGNNKLAMLVLDAIRRDIAIADGKVARAFVSPHADLQAAETETPPEQQVRPMPIFGQMAGAKEELPLTMFIADAQWASAVLAIGGSRSNGEALSTPQTVISALKERVAPDSTAGLLLFEGRWPKARKGRYDDFSWPKPD
jgi:uncharacterized protein